MKIYTKTGDRGETSLFDGTRVAKDDPRVAAYGDLDECNAQLGLVLSLLPDASELRPLLLAVQRKLFHVGAILADPRQKSPRREKETLDAQDIETLEIAIDEWESILPPLKSFILPGGAPGGAALHVARAVSRRAEREAIALNKKDPLPPLVIPYLNRLSDFLFVAARYANFREGIREEAW